MTQSLYLSQQIQPHFTFKEVSGTSISRLLSQQNKLSAGERRESVTNYQPCVRELMNMCIPARSWGSTKLHRYNTIRVT